MRELIMPVESVTQILNMFPKIEHVLNFDERIALKAYIGGNPTDDQQARVLYICRAIMDTNPIGRDVNGQKVS